MICKSQPNFLRHKPTPIRNIWEVRLDQDIWKKIQLTAKHRKVSYSWIVRFCIQSLASKNHAESKVLIIGQKRCNNLSTSHRHRLCLYGDDETTLRIMAMQYNITVSALIRYALENFLFLLDKPLVSDQILFEKGIKIVAKIEFSIQALQQTPRIYLLTGQNFRPEDWWPSARLIHNLDFTYPDKAA